jgi:hypothetical protein
MYPFKLFDTAHGYTVIPASRETSWIAIAI